MRELPIVINKRCLIELQVFFFCSCFWFILIGWVPIFPGYPLTNEQNIWELPMGEESEVSFGNQCCLIAVLLSPQFYYTWLHRSCLYFDFCSWNVGWRLVSKQVFCSVCGWCFAILREGKWYRSTSKTLKKLKAAVASTSKMSKFSWKINPLYFFKLKFTNSKLLWYVAWIVLLNLVLCCFNLSVNCY